jgi:hypothetical protein
MNQQQWTECPEGTLRKIAAKKPNSSQTYGPYVAGTIVGLVASIALFGSTMLKTSGGSSDTFSTQQPVVQQPVMLQCYDVKPLLAKYHGGKLDSTTTEQVAQHLHKCDRCSQYFMDNFPADTASMDDFRSWLVQSGQITR